MAWRVAQGFLWEHLSCHLARRLIVVTTVEDLRRSEVQISRGLSWERTAQDVAWELVYNPKVNALSRARYLVLSFDTSGAMLLARREEPGEAASRVAPPACALFYDPQGSEDAWVQDHPGRMIGYTTCLAGGLLREILLAPERPDMAQGTQSGLAAMRRLHLEGYGDRNAAPAQVRLAFPHALVATELARDGAPFAVTVVQDPGRFLLGPLDVKGQESGWWTILHDRYAGTLGQVARQIVLEGELLEKLAEAAHDVFCEEMAAQGYRWGPTTDDQLKTHSALVPYPELPEGERELNRGTVRDIPHKLALAGHIMLPARSNERPFEFPGPELERLARLEHERWVQARLATSWRHGPVTDPQGKVHEALVAWEDLPEAQKEKDRVLVREIPRILARAGYAVVRLGAAEAQHPCAG